MKNEALPAVPNMEESQAEALTAAARQGHTAHWQTTCPATLDLFHLCGACPSPCRRRTYHGTMLQNAERVYPAVGNKTSTLGVLLVYTAEKYIVSMYTYSCTV